MTTKDTPKVGPYTPGPWTVERKRGRYVVTAPTGERVAHVVKWVPDVEVADAHLIAAAPELLAALKALMDDYEQLIGAGVVSSNEPTQLSAARAAIAKAEGGAR